MARETMGWLDPRVRDGLGRKQILQLRKGETSEFMERHPEGKYVALSRYHKVAVMMCKNRLRNPWTTAVGDPLPATKLVHIYPKECDDVMYRQRFSILMFGVAAVDSARHDTVKLVLRKNNCYDNGTLWWEHAELVERTRTLMTVAKRYENERAFWKNWIKAIGKPIEGERFGTGDVLSKLTMTVTPSKGGVSEVHYGYKGAGI